MKNTCIAVLQAGGKGTRLVELTRDEIPKPLLKIGGKPMIQWQIENLKKYGIQEFIIIVGYLGEKIQEYFGDGNWLDVNIQYIKEETPLGSGGALYYLKEQLFDKNFLMVFGDVMFDINLIKMIDFHEKKESLATLLVHPNGHPQDSDLIIINEENCVIGFDSKENERNYWYDNCVNAGIYVLSGKLLKGILKPSKIDLEKDLLLPLIKERRIYAYRTPEYVKDIGTVSRFNLAEEELKKGLWEQKNLENTQKCIFLDRDGTVNIYKGLISKEEQLELEKRAAEAIKLINTSGYLAILVTNQPVVARGLCEIKDVEKIHKKLVTLLGEEGAYLDDIIFCPHHPDKGYPGENKTYKVECSCRKPQTEMIDIMIEKYNIDRKKSYMIGDTTIDIQTGINAGLNTVLVHTGQAGADNKYKVRANCESEDILEAVKRVLKEGDEF